METDHMIIGFLVSFILGILFGVTLGSGFNIQDDDGRIERAEQIMDMTEYNIKGLGDYTGYIITDNTTIVDLKCVYRNYRMKAGVYDSQNFLRVGLNYICDGVGRNPLD